jgi:hypothetical protein
MPIALNHLPRCHLLPGNAEKSGPGLYIEQNSLHGSVTLPFMGTRHKDAM